MSDDEIEKIEKVRRYVECDGIHYIPGMNTDREALSALLDVVSALVERVDELAEQVDVLKAENRRDPDE